MKSLRAGAFFAFRLPVGGRAPLPPVSYATTHSGNVPPPKPRVKAKPSLLVQFSLFMHPDQAQNTLSGIQGQEATAVAVIYVTAPTSSRKTTKCK